MVALEEALAQKRPLVSLICHSLADLNWAVLFFGSEVSPVQEAFLGAVFVESGQYMAYPWGKERVFPWDPCDIQFC